MSGAFVPVSILYPAFNIDVNLLDHDVSRNNFFPPGGGNIFFGA
ncbi:Uncharacterised protein [Enterobacter cancerogenus]|uniref:Uncharacterized protein n=1 Tax=Enterobacter cancerogenus TaxID=69218 RepID=A0A484YXT5_9ENTR|nr:Uncharacterised protein [Enterobacter cancerogenus]